jgi:hypothetical protein
MRLAIAPIFSLRLIANTQGKISSPACGPTIEVPSTLPQLVVTTLIRPSVCRSVWARSLSSNRQRSTSIALPRLLASASVRPT